METACGGLSCARSSIGGEPHSSCHTCMRPLNWKTSGGGSWCGPVPPVLRPLTEVPLPPAPVITRVIAATSGAVRVLAAAA
jgi:hypothetical protein